MVEYEQFIPLVSGLIIIFISNRYVNNYQRNKDKIKIKHDIINEVILAWQSFSNYIEIHRLNKTAEEGYSLRRDIMQEYSFHVDTCKGLIIVYGKEITYIDAFNNFISKISEMNQSLAELANYDPSDDTKPVQAIPIDDQINMHNRMNKIFNDLLIYLRTIEIEYDLNAESIFFKLFKWLKRNDKPNQ